IFAPPIDRMAGRRFQTAFAGHCLFLHPPLREGRTAIAVRGGVRVAAPPFRPSGTFPHKGGRAFVSGYLLAQRVERFLEPAGMTLLGLGKGLEPVGDLIEAFLARGSCHARIHVGVFMRLAMDRRREVMLRRANRPAGGRVANRFQVFEMTMSMSGLALC